MSTQTMTIRGVDYSDPLRTLLEDFEIVGNNLAIALLHGPVVSTSLRQNIHAAIVASTLGLSDLNNTKKKYCLADPEPETESPTRKSYELYKKSYTAAKQYICTIIKKMRREGMPPVRIGVFGASLVLQRLIDSFFSAHLLYLLGNRYEGHAVSRLILEQIAWAYVAINSASNAELQKIITTKAVFQLRKKLPAAGKLYGYLSEKTHIDYRNHPEFLFLQNENYCLLRTQLHYREYSVIILELADLFGIVWEQSQFDYIPVPETVTRDDNGFNVNPNRPFAGEMKHLLLEFDEIPGDWGSGPDLGGH